MENEEQKIIDAYELLKSKGLTISKKDDNQLKAMNEVLEIKIMNENKIKEILYKLEEGKNNVDYTYRLLDTEINGSYPVKLCSCNMKIDVEHKYIDENCPIHTAVVKENELLHSVSKSVICDYCKDMGRRYCGVPLGNIKCPKCGEY